MSNIIEFKFPREFLIQLLAGKPMDIQDKKITYRFTVDADIVMEWAKLMDEREDLGLLLN